MPFEVVCTNCNAKLEAPDEFHQTIVSCATCHSEIFAKDKSKIIPNPHANTASCTSKGCLIFAAAFFLIILFSIVIDSKCSAPTASPPSDKLREFRINREEERLKSERAKIARDALDYIESQRLK